MFIIEWYWFGAVVFFALMTGFVVGRTRDSQPTDYDEGWQDGFDDAILKYGIDR